MMKTGQKGVEELGRVSGFRFLVSGFWLKREKGEGKIAGCGLKSEEEYWILYPSSCPTLILSHPLFLLN
jgi:hypothetical protein